MAARSVVRAARSRDQRSDLNAARSSEENSSGSSQAAKWPPLSTSLKYVRSGGRLAAVGEREHRPLVGGQLATSADCLAW
jgi:hypothetical protein